MVNLFCIDQSPLVFRIQGKTGFDLKFLIFESYSARTQKFPQKSGFLLILVNYAILFVVLFISIWIFVLSYYIYFEIVAGKTL